MLPPSGSEALLDRHRPHAEANRRLAARHVADHFLKLLGIAKTAIGFEQPGSQGGQILIEADRAPVKMTASEPGAPWHTGEALRGERNGGHTFSRI